MRQLPPSATLEFNRKVREHVQAGKKILSLGLGEAEIPTPHHIVEAGRQALLDGWTKYSAAPGLPVLRERIAQKLAEVNHVAAQPDDVLVTPGAKNALFLACMAVLEGGDEAVLIRPCYVSNLPMIALAADGVLVREVALAPETFDLDFGVLERTVTSQTRLLFLNTPHNPTGRMLSIRDIEFLAELMRKNPRLIVLSDEVYDAITPGGKKHLSIGAVPDVADRVITVGGFSKTYFMTGWRIGYVHASRAIARSMRSIHEHINTNTAAFIQMAALAALEGPQDCIADYVRKLEERKAIYERFLATAAGLRGSAYEGGYFSLLDVSGSGLDGDAFAVRLLEQQGVAVVPGAAFGSCSSGYCRLSFVNRTDLFEEGLRRIQAQIGELSA